MAVVIERARVEGEDITHLSDSIQNNTEKFDKRKKKYKKPRY